MRSHEVSGERSERDHQVIELHQRLPAQRQAHESTLNWSVWFDLEITALTAISGVRWTGS